MFKAFFSCSARCLFIDGDSVIMQLSSSIRCDSFSIIISKKKRFTKNHCKKKQKNPNFVRICLKFNLFKNIINEENYGKPIMLSRQREIRLKAQSFPV